MTGKNPFSARHLAELEGDATPFAAAPGLIRKREVHAGNQTVAVSTVRLAVYAALLETGYDQVLADKMAAAVAEQVPAIEQQVKSAA